MGLTRCARFAIRGSAFPGRINNTCSRRFIAAEMSEPVRAPAWDCSWSNDVSNSIGAMWSCPANLEKARLSPSGFQFLKRVYEKDPGNRRRTGNETKHHDPASLS